MKAAGLLLPANWQRCLFARHDNRERSWCYCKTRVRPPSKQSTLKFCAN